MRESLFNILIHAYDDPVQDARVLDLFAGTGALGIEAISRGAAYCLFVEDHADARGLIRDNVEAFGLTGVTRIFRRDATDLGRANARDSGFNLVFCDPPYGRGLGERALCAAIAGGWLADGAVVALEEREGTDIALPAGLSEIDRRSWGGTQVVLCRYAAV